MDLRESLGSDAAHWSLNASCETGDESGYGMRSLEREYRVPDVAQAAAY